MANLVRKVIGGSSLIGAIHRKAVRVFNFETKKVCFEVELYEDTDLRVAMSNDDEWLLIGSWNHGLKVVCLSDLNTIEYPNVAGMTNLDFFTKSSKICCGANKNGGCQLVDAKYGGDVINNNQFKRIFEINESGKYVGVSSARDEVSILNSEMRVEHSFPWEVGGISSCSSHERNVVLSGSDGSLIWIDLVSQTATTSPKNSLFSGVDNAVFHDDGEGLFMLASEYEGGNKSALISVNKKFEVSKISDISDCTLRSAAVDGNFILRSGAIVSMKSGDQGSRFDW